ncbi:MAG: type II secretion system F family protein [Candidatus Obscuribacterales bacterium]|nr:type II secretion system F family protein [Candidatus Obscuribacterales bacterium]
MSQLLSQNLEFFVAGLLALALFLVPADKAKSSELRTNILDDLAYTFFQMFPASYRNWLELKLTYAGFQSRQASARLASFKIYPALAALFLLLLLNPLIVTAIAAVSFFIADLYVFVAAKKRQEEIATSLPQAIDLMLLCVDAGLGLDATMQKIAADSATLTSALNDELAKLGRDMLLGMDREKAYQELYLRTGVEELKSFGAALNQSSKMGLSVSKILRAQSQFIRMRQSQKAEEKAARLPIWMAFPLWFCIMPSLLLILLGPSLIKFFENIAPLQGL